MRFEGILQRTLAQGSERIKIAVVVWDLSISGGTQRQALELASYLAQRKHTVKVFCGYLDKARCYPDLIGQFEIHCLHEMDYAERPQLKSPLRKIFYPCEPILSKEESCLAKMMDDDFDVVNPHEHRAYRTAYYYKKQNKKPVVWMVNDLPGSIARGWNGIGLRKVVLKVHYILFGGFIGFYIDRERMRTIDISVVFDENSRKSFLRAIGKEPSRVNSGLDPFSFEFHEKSLDPGKLKLRLLAVGIFFPHRRYEDLIVAVNTLVGDGWDVSLDIVGSDAYDKLYARRIRELVSSMGLNERVRFRGAVSEDELRDAYSAADVFVFPNWPQTWGLAVFEAMASGTPSVVSTGAGASEILVDGENALLFQPGRPEEIVACLKRLREDSRLYSRLSRKGRGFVEKNVTWEVYGHRMESLLEKAIAARRL